MAMEKKSKAQGQLDRLAGAADNRRKKAAELKAQYNAEKNVGGTANLDKWYKAARSMNKKSPANAKGEFTAGPLSGGESRTYSRAKRDVLKQELAKRKAAGDAQMMRRPGESVEAYNKRIKTMTYGNPNE